MKCASLPPEALMERCVFTTCKASNYCELSSIQHLLPSTQLYLHRTLLQSVHSSLAKITFGTPSQSMDSFWLTCQSCQIRKKRPRTKEFWPRTVRMWSAHKSLRIAITWTNSYTAQKKATSFFVCYHQCSASVDCRLATTSLSWLCLWVQIADSCTWDVATAGWL